MDILHLIDRLEALISGSRRIPLTTHIIVDEEAYLDIIDQLRISIPEELRESKRLLQERQRIISQSQEEAKRIVALAREEAAHLLDQHAMVKDAQSRGRAAREQAQREADAVQAGADEYAIQSLQRLETLLAPLLNEVRNGLATLQQEPGSSEEPKAGGDPETR